MIHAETVEELKIQKFSGKASGTDLICEGGGLQCESSDENKPDVTRNVRPLGIVTGAARLRRTGIDLRHLQ